MLKNTKRFVIEYQLERGVGMRQSVEIPVQLLKKLLQTGEALDDFHNAFEDYLISINSPLLRKLRKARREHLAGKTRPFAELKREFGLR